MKKEYEFYDELTVELDELVRKSCESFLAKWQDMLNRQAWECFEKGMFGTSVPKGLLNDGQTDGLGVPGDCGHPGDDRAAGGR